MNNIHRITFFYILSFLFLMLPAYAWGAYVDLSTFTIENYNTLDGPGIWTVSGSGNSQVTQSSNGDPTIFRSGGTINVASKIITGEFSISGLDDDVVGFVFGYQSRGQMYLFGWKEQPQSVKKGMYLSLIDTGNPSIDPARNDFLNTGSDTTVTTILRENDLSWQRNITYSFDLNFTPGNFDLTILDGTTVIEMWAISDSTFIDGDFGFFNASQPGVTYGNLLVSNVPIPASIWLFSAGLFGLIGISRRKNIA